MPTGDHPLLDGRPALRHVELGVRDLTRSERFYRELLGFTPVPGGDGGGTLEMAAGAARLKLVETGPAGVPSGWRDEDLQAGFRHVGFKVGDVDSGIARLVAAGVELKLAPLDAFGDVRIAFFHDPDGTCLEFVAGQVRYQPVWSPELAAREEASLGGGWDGAPRFDHVAVTVADFDESLHYYRDVLGLPVIGQLDRHGEDERGFLITYFQAGDCVLEVFSFSMPTEPSPWRADPALLGIRAVGLAADEPAALGGALTAAGGRVRDGIGGPWLVTDRNEVALDLARG